MFKTKDFDFLTNLLHHILPPNVSLKRTRLKHTCQTRLAVTEARVLLVCSLRTHLGMTIKNNKVGHIEPLMSPKYAKKLKDTDVNDRVRKLNVN